MDSKTEFDLKYAITQQIRSINVENLEEIAFINEYSLSKGLVTNIGSVLILILMLKHLIKLLLANQVVNLVYLLIKLTLTQLLTLKA